MPRLLAALAAIAVCLDSCGGLPAVVGSRDRTQVWIDTDAGFGISGSDVDDGWAMIAAFHSNTLQVVGVSAVFGEVPMDDAYASAGELAGLFGPSELPVYPGAESPRDLGRETNRVVDRELLLAAQPVAQALPFDERHHIVGGAVDLAAIDQAQDVRMLQGGDGLDLAEEALGPDDRGQLWAHHLDRDFAIVLEVLGQVDRGHAALAELPLDAVAVGEGSLQSGHRLGHRGRLSVGAWKMGGNGVEG